MYAVEEVVVDLSILSHAPQQFVNEMTNTKAHPMAVGIVRLKGKYDIIVSYKESTKNAYKMLHLISKVYIIKTFQYLQQKIKQKI